MTLSNGHSAGTSDPNRAIAGELVPIDEVARRLGVRASAIRYYEERGLVHPAARRAGRRWYGPDEIRHLAIIRYWQESGLMSLDEIREILAGPGANRQWAEVVGDRVEALGAQIAQMESAREFLEHILTFHGDGSPDGCPHYETLIWDHGDKAGHPGHPSPRASGPTSGMTTASSG